MLLRSRFCVPSVETISRDRSTLKEDNERPISSMDILGDKLLLSGDIMVPFGDLLESMGLSRCFGRFSGGLLHFENNDDDANRMSLERNAIHARTNERSF